VRLAGYLRRRKPVFRCPKVLYKDDNLNEGLTLELSIAKVGFELVSVVSVLCIPEIVHAATQFEAHFLDINNSMSFALIATTPTHVLSTASQLIHCYLYGTVEVQVVLLVVMLFGVDAGNVVIANGNVFVIIWIFRRLKYVT
jgi:hypothetical protein